MPRPDLGRSRLDLRITPQARALLGEHPSERAREVIERWASERAVLVTRGEIEAMRDACVRTDDGEGVELLSEALAGDEGSVAWCRGVELVLGQREP